MGLVGKVVEGFHEEGRFEVSGEGSAGATRGGGGGNRDGSGGPHVPGLKQEEAPRALASPSFEELVKDQEIVVRICERKTVTETETLSVPLLMSSICLTLMQNLHEIYHVSLCLISIS